jgi:hypothetical protein
MRILLDRGQLWLDPISNCFFIIRQHLGAVL